MSLRCLYQIAATVQARASVGSTGRSATTLNNWLFGIGGSFRPQGLVLVAFSKTRAVNSIQLSSNTNSQALEPIWLPTVGSYSRTFLQLQRDQGGGKTGRKKKGKQKGAPPRAPTKPKGGEARTRAPQGEGGGEKKEPVRCKPQRHYRLPVSGQGHLHSSRLPTVSSRSD